MDPEIINGAKKVELWNTLASWQVLGFQNYSSF